MATKADQIHHLLRADIVAGRFEQGKPLDEAALATTFGASRTPVREALRRLQSEGLLVAGSRRQLFVVDLSESHRREVTVLRDALEGTAAAEACRCWEPDDLDQLRVAIMRQRRAAAADDAETFLGLDETFHRQLAAVARMPTLSMLLGQLGPFVRLARIAVPTDANHMLGLIAEHEHLVDLLEKRDPALLRAALSKHIHDTAPRHPASS